MLILHAAPAKGSLILWSEDSELHPTPPDRQRVGKHPYCAQGQLIAQAVGLQTGDNDFASATAWLPSQGESPVPSSPMAGPVPTSRARPRLRPWTVSALRLSPDHTIQLLQRCHQRHVLKPGVAMGTDLAYWTNALQLALSLAARQQFLPGLTERDGQTVAAWTPVFIGEDARRLAELARLMPAPARALTDAGATQPPATAAQAVLHEFITTQLDHLARTGTEAENRAEPQFDSAHDAWLYALCQTNPAVRSSPEQLRLLRRQVAEWQRPLAIAVNSPYRLCLRLEEPPEPGPEDEASPILQEDWYLRYLLQPHDDPILLLPAEAVWKKQVNEPHPDFNPAEFLLSSLAQAGAVFPPITESLRRQQPAGFQLNTQEAYGFLESQAAALQQAGFRVLLPAWWTRRGAGPRPGIRARAKTPAMQGGSGMNMTSLIDLDVEMALGDEPISVDELEQLAELKVPLVRFRGQWMEINAEEIRAAADFWRRRQQVSLREVVEIGLGANQRAQDDNVTLVADDWLREVLENLQQKGRIELLDAPKGFAGQLRPYQQMGYSWLAFPQRMEAGSLPGRRHGPGQDRPGPGSPGTGPPAGKRSAQPAGLPDFRDQQTGSGRPPGLRRAWRSCCTTARTDRKGLPLPARPAGTTSLSRATLR